MWRDGCCSEENSILSNNENKGVIKSPSFGMVAVLRDNAIAKENKNFKDIIGDNATGIVGELIGQSQAINNHN